MTDHETERYFQRNAKKWKAEENDKRDSNKPRKHKLRKTHKRSRTYDTDRD